MTKAKMMETMSAKIKELLASEEFYRNEVARCYLSAANQHNGGMSVSQMVKIAVTRLRATGQYKPDVKFDIEYMEDSYREYNASASEMKAMFVKLFEIGYEYAHCNANNAAIAE